MARITHRNIILAFLSLLSLGSLIIAWLDLVALEPGTNLALIASIACLGQLALLVAARRGWRYAPHCTTLFFTLVVAFALPEPFVTTFAPLAIALPPTLALVLLNPVWVVFTGVLEIGVLLARAQGQGVYANSTTLTVFGMVIGGMVLGRLLFDNARHAAELAAAELELQRDKLRESEEHYRALFEQANEMVFTLDLAGWLTSINQSGERAIGYSHDELLHSPFVSLVAPAYQERALEMIAQMIGGIQHVTIELELVARDGRHIMFEVGSRVRFQAGMPMGIQSIARDVTERKQIEAILIAERASLARQVDERTADLSAANAQLARAARLKDEFMANMSHELRTPLNAILGLSEALQEEVYGALNDKQQSIIHSVEQSGRHLLDLINDILDLSKIEADKLQLGIEPVAIEMVCRASLQFIQPLAREKRLTVSSSFDPAVKWVPADQRRLKQILVNLLSNAAKFTPEGGAIGLEVVDDRAHQAIRVMVWDTGIGIAPQDQSQLFQRFTQLDSRLSRQYSGTGLGLALVRRLAELHGGRVSLDSAVGHGSRFTLALPCPDADALNSAASPAATPLEPASFVQWARGTDIAAQSVQAAGEANKPEPAPSLPAAGPAARQPLVLLAEDHDANISTTLEYLQIKGYRVVVAKNGFEAVSRARECAPDLILMDVQMPELDGLAAIRQIRAEAELAGTPIIALTALAMPGDRERCLAAGANMYLSKPVSLKMLASELATQLAKRAGPAGSS